MRITLESASGEDGSVQDATFLGSDSIDAFVFAAYSSSSFFNIALQSTYGVVFPGDCFLFQWVREERVAVILFCPGTELNDASGGAIYAPPSAGVILKSRSRGWRSTVNR